MFYVLLATRAVLRERGHFADGAEPNLAALLDLVALGTVADVVRLDRINRTLVAHGLARIRAGRAQPGIARAVRGRRSRSAPRDVLRPGLRRRARASMRRDGFADMAIGIRCLLADTDGGGATARRRARPAESRAARRRSDDAGSGARRRRGASARRAPRTDAYTLCLFDAGMAPGRGRHRRRPPQGPLSPPGHRLRARERRRAQGLGPVDRRASICAMRSISSPSARPACSTRFGGHAYAAGLSRSPNPTCRGSPRSFEAIAREQLTPGDLARTLESDGTLAPGELGIELAARAARRRSGARDSRRRRSTTRFRCSTSGSSAASHSKLALARGGERFDAILFRHADPLPASIRAAYRPEVNEWRGEAHRCNSSSSTGSRPDRRDVTDSARLRRAVAGATSHVAGRVSSRVATIRHFMHATY